MRRPYSIIYLREGTEVETVVGPPILAQAKAQALDKFPGMQAQLGVTNIRIRDDVGRSVFFHPRTARPIATR